MFVNIIILVLHEQNRCASKMSLKISTYNDFCILNYRVTCLMNGTSRGCYVANI